MSHWFLGLSSVSKTTSLTSAVLSSCCHFEHSFREFKYSVHQRSQNSLTRLLHSTPVLTAEFRLGSHSEISTYQTRYCELYESASPKLLLSCLIGVDYVSTRPNHRYVDSENLRFSNGSSSSRKVACLHQRSLCVIGSNKVNVTTPLDETPRYHDEWIRLEGVCYLEVYSTGC